MGIWMPGMTVRPMNPVTSSMIRIDRDLVRTYPRPRVTAMVPRVVMMGFRSRRVMKKPLKAPMAAPRARAMGTRAQAGTGGVRLNR